MAFSLPDLPYAYDALAPYMSKETLEFHHDKHHNAYVTTGNGLITGTDFENLSLTKIVKKAYADGNQALINQAGQHYNHVHFWQWMKPNGGGKSLPGKVEALVNAYGGYDKVREDFI
ncbi:MAG: superoxide dismutase, partial [Pseudomonadota bacterium]